LQIIAYCENCGINPLKSAIFAIINPQLILQPIGYRPILTYSDVNFMELMSYDIDSMELTCSDVDSMELMSDDVNSTELTCSDADSIE